MPFRFLPLPDFLKSFPSFDCKKLIVSRLTDKIVVLTVSMFVFRLNKFLLSECYARSHKYEFLVFGASVENTVTCSDDLSIYLVAG